MSYAILLVVEKPPKTDPEHRNHEEHDNYDNAIKGIRGLTSTDKSLQALGENVLLISLDDTLNTLSEAIRMIHPAPYRFAIFPEDICWQKVGKPAMMA